MIRQLWELCFTTCRGSGAIEMPQVIAARDDLARRFTRAAMSTDVVAAQPPPVTVEIELEETPPSRS